MARCFVMQPFDGASFDKRFDDVLAPAISAAGLEPYRVDRDAGVAVPIDDIEQSSFMGALLEARQEAHFDIDGSSEQLRAPVERLVAWLAEEPLIRNVIHHAHARQARS